MAQRWIVALEASAGAGDGGIGDGDVTRLLEALDARGDGGALKCPDRYALQVAAIGADPAEALLGVLARWRDAVRHLGLPAWSIVRTEVMTPEELERDFETYSFDLPSAGSVPVGGRPESQDPGVELLRRAFSDPLTGLLDPGGFEHRLVSAVDRPGAARHVAVLYLDLDGFGAIVDRLGGAAGDQVLVAVAERLAVTLRPSDDVVRFRSDDYAVLLEGITEHGAVAVAERMLEAVRAPLTVQGRQVALSASAGVAVSEPGENAQTLLRRAEAAVTLARKAGGDRHVLSCPSTLRPSSSERCRVTEAARDWLANLLLMQQAAVAANEADCLQEAAEVVIRQICSHVGCGIGRLWVPPDSSLPEPSPSAWHIADTNAYSGFRELTDSQCSLPFAGLTGRVFATGRPIWITDLQNDPDWLSRVERSRADLESGFAFPIVVGWEVVGVVEFYFRDRTEPTGSFLDVLVGIGAHLGRVVERQRAAAAMEGSAAQLRESEARLRHAQALAHLGSWYFDLPTGESSWSDEMYSLYGLDPDGPALDLELALSSVDPADRARAHAALSRLVESGEETAEEVRIVRPDGEVRWHNVSGSVIRDENGAVVAIYGTSYDITERKAVEDALRERQVQLSEAQRVARLGSWELDLSTGRVTCAEELFRLWGWEPRSDLTIHAFFATVRPGDRRALIREARGLHRSGIPLCMDFRAATADRGRRWFRGRGQTLHDENGKPIKLVGTVQDVTEEKEAEEALRTTKEMYQQIVETAHEGILMVDSSDRTTFANGRMALMLGYSVEEMLGMPSSAFVQRETLPSLAAHRRRRRAGLSEHYQTELRAKDGSVVPVLVSASPLMDEAGEYCGALAMVTDVTASRPADHETCHQADGRTGM